MASSKDRPVGLGSEKDNGREPKSCLGRVFNSKLGHFVVMHTLLGTYAGLDLELKTWAIMGSAISNRREPKSCLGRVFNSKTGHIATLRSSYMACMQGLLKLKTRPRVRPVS